MTMRPRARALGVAAACLLLVAPTSPESPGDVRVAPVWGATGHEMAARAAAAKLPDSMPAFFRRARNQLVYLNPEPDRWRVRESREMDQAFAYDHYIDLENLDIGPGRDAFLNAPDRYAFIRLLHEAGVARPERDVGFLPFRIVELYQRTVSGWRRWRAEDDARRRRWIEERIVADAGVLGHYVTDASQPHHTTVHFNGWNAEKTPNPGGYATDRGFHSRFETGFVEAHVRDRDVLRLVDAREPPPSVAGDVRAAVMEHIVEAHKRVEMLYLLDRDLGFDPGAEPDPVAREFAAERLAAGARMLATLWWSAWLESAPTEGDGAGSGT